MRTILEIGREETRAWCEYREETRRCREELLRIRARRRRRKRARKKAGRAMRAAVARRYAAYARVVGLAREMAEAHVALARRLGLPAADRVPDVPAHGPVSQAHMDRARRRRSVRRRRLR